MATLEMVYGDERMVFEFEANGRVFLGPANVTRTDSLGRPEEAWSCACLKLLPGRDVDSVDVVCELSHRFKRGAFDDCKAEADWCRILADREGLVAVRLNGSTVWSAAADAEAEALSDGWTG